LALVNTALLGARTARRARRKNIKIAPAYAKASAGRQKKSVFSPPLIFFFFEKEQTIQCQKNQRLMKNLRRESISGLSDGLLFRLYNVLFSFFSATKL
jgi:hypothetical protein